MEMSHVFQKLYKIMPKSLNKQFIRYQKILKKLKKINKILKKSINC